MTAATFEAITELTCPWLVKSHYRHNPLGVALPGGVGVYVGESLGGDVVYVGSVVRPAVHSGIAHRVVEHHRGRTGGTPWGFVHVIQLKAETPREVVRGMEGAVGHILRPVANRRLPRE